MGTHKFKTTNIKGKEYVEVNQRLLFFRNEKKYEGWGIETHFLVLDSESCVAPVSYTHLTLPTIYSV